jgi:Flp pilus assembly protein TadG
MSDENAIGHRHGEQGQALIEFALVLTILLMLLLGMVEYTLAATTQQFVNEAAREGAIAAADASSLRDAQRRATDRIRDVFRDRGMFARPGDTLYQGSVSLEPGDLYNRGGRFTVTVSYRYRPTIFTNVPFIPLGDGEDRGIAMTAQAGGVVRPYRSWWPEESHP